jgi:hypothetical protein
MLRCSNGFLPFLCECLCEAHEPVRAGAASPAERPHVAPSASGSVGAPLLICRECSIDIPAMLLGYATKRRLNAAINRLLARFPKALEMAA